MPSKHICQRCGTSTGRNVRAKYCLPCAQRRQREANARYMMGYREKNREVLRAESRAHHLARQAD